MRTLLVCGLLLIAAPAFAQGTVTVESLMTQGYDVGGVVRWNPGPGMLLEDDDKLVMFFVSETPGSPDISTQYCKPVR